MYSFPPVLILQPIDGPANEKKICSDCGMAKLGEIQGRKATEAFTIPMMIKA